MGKAARSTIPTWKLAAAGAVGSLAPEIALLYSKRWTMGGLHFELGQYLLVTLVYAAVAGFVAAIYPYSGTATRWRAFQIGIGVPVVVGVGTTFMRDREIERGLDSAGSLIDLLSLF